MPEHEKSEETMEENLLNEKQAGQYLGGVAKKTLQHWRWRGCGPAYVKIGRLVRYAIKDLDEWISMRKLKPVTFK